MTASLPDSPAPLVGLVHGCPPAPLALPGLDEAGAAGVGAGIRELVAAPCGGPCDGATTLEVRGLGGWGLDGWAPRLPGAHPVAVPPGARVDGLSAEHDGPVRHGLVTLVEARRGTAGGAGSPQLHHRLLVRGRSDVPLVLELLSDLRRDPSRGWRAASVAAVRLSALPQGVAIDEPGPDGADDCLRLLAGRLVSLSLVSTGMLQVRRPGRVGGLADHLAGRVRSAPAPAVGAARRWAVSEGR
ncbi:hypothetical protein F1C15_10090 [Frigoribacterium sp. NBH87]|uniref:hypothetical protein n=1 Tax=unclassified Frigoribacterium TaxID=2627005 RepID=UPI001628EB7E|nr:MULTISPECIES: hypothetical protein [unclassified Frigoribacterium]MBD8729214.1 hypothetical protein [Frigoribacterium sp. CFBP 13707]QNE44114.1 hypothetical protein F1C15_10090 [Frigoribacterium sp. NBH87]